MFPFIKALHNTCLLTITYWKDTRIALKPWCDPSHVLFLCAFPLFRIFVNQFPWSLLWAFGGSMVCCSTNHTDMQSPVCACPARTSMFATTGSIVVVALPLAILGCSRNLFVCKLFDVLWGSWCFPFTPSFAPSFISFALSFSFSFSLALSFYLPINQNEFLCNIIVTNMHMHMDSHTRQASVIRCSTILSCHAMLTAWLFWRVICVHRSDCGTLFHCNRGRPSNPTKIAIQHFA